MSIQLRVIINTVEIFQSEKKDRKSSRRFQGQNFKSVIHSKKNWDIIQEVLDDNKKAVVLK